jgi:hypothetical protein
MVGVGAKFTVLPFFHKNVFLITFSGGFLSGVSRCAQTEIPSTLFVRANDFPLRPK